MKIRTSLIAFTALLATTFPAFAAEESVQTDLGTLDTAKAGEAFKKHPYSPYADRKFPMKPLFGDTHLHTGFSLDAGAFGCRLTPRARLSLRTG